MTECLRRQLINVYTFKVTLMGLPRRISTFVESLKSKNLTHL